jgi:hypothetical protein
MRHWRFGWALAFVSVFAACGCNTDDPPETGPDADAATIDSDADPIGPDGRPCADRPLAGCPCAPEGRYRCVYDWGGGQGVQCIRATWSKFNDGPCGWMDPDASNCTDQVVDCRCLILGERICANGTGLMCLGNGRWVSDPTSCGDGATPDPDAASDADGTPDVMPD